MTPEIQQFINEAIDKKSSLSTFEVASVPFHTHNSFDSKQIAFKDLLNKEQTVSVHIPGGTSSADYGVIFIATRQCRITSIAEVHGTAGTDAGAVTTILEKLIGTEAVGTGVDILQTPFDMKFAKDTVQYADMAQIPKDNFNLNRGDRLAIVTSGTFTSVNNVVYSLNIIY